MSVIKTYFDKTAQGIKNTIAPVIPPPPATPTQAQPPAVQPAPTPMPPVSPKPEPSPTPVPQPVELPQPPAKTKKSESATHKLFTPLALVIVVTLVSLGINGLLVYSLLGGGPDLASAIRKTTSGVLGTGAGQTQEEDLDTIDQISQFLVLPVNEQPNIATITDVTKLKSQAFFLEAQNGDVVLVYKEAQKAILYRPSQKKIINMSTVSENSTQSLPDSDPQSP
jgi:hypothetical protein